MSVCTALVSRSRRDYLTVKSIDGQRTALPCLPCSGSPCSQDVLWVYYNETRSAEVDIATSGMILNGHKMRFVLEPNTSRLIVSSIRQSDSGMYYCVEGNGQGKRHHVYLIVQPGEAYFTLFLTSMKFNIVLRKVVTRDVIGQSCVT